MPNNFHKFIVLHDPYLKNSKIAPQAFGLTVAYKVAAYRKA